MTFPVRSLLRPLRHAPDRALHPARRAAASSRIAGLAGGQALFVCHGNICRSPYAEEAFRRLADAAGAEGWTSASAGFVLPGRRSPPSARAVAGRRGIDLEGHRSRVLSPELLASSALVFVMSRSQRSSLLRDHGLGPDRVFILGDLDPDPISRRTIEDPFEKPEGVFEAVYDRIDRCLGSLAELLATGASTRG